MTKIGFFDSDISKFFLLTLKVLMALGKKGFTDIAKVKYIGVDGDADAITQTVGGFTAAMTGDISGVVGFIKSGDVRVLASFTDERIPGFLSLIHI